MNSQLVCILCYVYLEYLFPLFHWHSCKLVKLSACIAKCMTTINKYFFYNDKQSVVVLLGKVEEMKARLLQLEQENTKVIARL